ncbi:MAG TPA: hypothetical protein VHQ22_00725 [Terriglobales bacterium]|nr:hypothetical protein [Terriglobales bacterium]
MNIVLLSSILIALTSYGFGQDDLRVQIIPSTTACGHVQPQEDVTMLDLRACPAAQQIGSHLLFAVKDTNNGGVRDKILLVDPFTPSAVMSRGSSSASLYVHSFGEGNLAGYGTLAAINGTITVDTGATGSPSAVVGIEGEAVVSGKANSTINDLRGGTFNVGAVGEGNVKNATALQAQAPTRLGKGQITNAVSFHAERPTVGSDTNLSGVFDGDVKLDGSLLFGGAPIHKILRASSTLTYPVIPERSCKDQPLKVAGALPESSDANASPNGKIGVDLYWSAWVSEPNTVSVRVCNSSLAPVKPLAVRWSASVMQ